jgi:hypothetical protein
MTKPLPGTPPAPPDPPPGRRQQPPGIRCGAGVRGRSPPGRKCHWAAVWSGQPLSTMRRCLMTPDRAREPVRSRYATNERAPGPGVPGEKCSIPPTRRAAPSQRLLWAQSADPPVRGLAKMSPGTSPCRDAAPHRMPFRLPPAECQGRDGRQQSRSRIGYRTTPATARRMVHTGSAAVRCPRTRAEIIAAPRPYEPELVRRCSLIGTTDSPRARPGTRPPGICS